MSHSGILPPVHDTSPPPFDDDVDENDIIPTIPNDELLSSTPPDVLNNSNDEWKSVDDNNDTDIAQIQDDIANVNNDENILPSVNLTNEEEEEEEEEEENNNNDDYEDWANFTSFDNKIDQVSEVPPTKSAVIEENTEAGWADFESNTIPMFEEPIQSFNDEQPNEIVKEEQLNEIVKEEQPNQIAKDEQPNQIAKDEQPDDDDDFGEFTEVQVAPKPQTTSVPTVNNTLSAEQIESLITTCFPTESVPSSTNTDCFLSTELPSFTTYKDQTKQISCLESSLSLWNVLSNLSNDPVGIQFQWRKSNSERLFHQALGVNERFRTKNVPLTPEILQPEKLKSTNSGNNESENIDNENKLSTESIRPHFDWKRSGLQNPLADNDSSSLSSNTSKNETNGFDANKTLDLDFYVPPMKSSNEEEQITSPSSILTNDSPIIAQQQQQRNSIPIKTMDLYPGSTTTLNDDAKRIIDSLPNLSFMSAKALMFPIRFNSNNNDESTTLY